MKNKEISFALNSLSRRSLTKLELFKKLKDKFGEDSASNTVEKVSHLINTEQITEFECDRLSRHKFYSNSRIKMHMSRRGISPELVEIFLQKCIIEERRILSFLEKKYKRDMSDKKPKIFRSLLALGYSSNLIKRCVDEYFNEFI